MGLFSWLFGRFEPPTDRQRRFAEALGIPITRGMSKQDVSAAIDRKKAADPKAFGKASGKLAKGSRRATALQAAIDGSSGDYSSGEADTAWLKTPEGRKAASLYRQWEKVSEPEPYGIFVYREPGTGQVYSDVARISGVDSDHDATGRVRVLLDVSLPEVVICQSSRQRVLEWSKDLGWFPAEDVVAWKKLPESFSDVDGCWVSSDATAAHRRQLSRYEAAVEKGAALATAAGIQAVRKQRVR
jgi:hypothetical protein